MFWAETYYSAFPPGFWLFALSFASGKMKNPKTTFLDADDFCAPSVENPDALKNLFTEL